MSQVRGQSFLCRFSASQGARWSWKVTAFRKTVLQAWKVVENSKGHGKVMENDDIVTEFLPAH